MFKIQRDLYTENSVFGFQNTAPMQRVHAVDARPGSHLHDDPAVAYDLAYGFGADGQVLLEIRSADGVRHVACETIDFVVAVHEHQGAVAT